MGASRDVEGQDGPHHHSQVAVHEVRKALLIVVFAIGCSGAQMEESPANNVNNVVDMGGDSGANNVNNVNNLNNSNNANNVEPGPGYSEFAAQFGTITTVAGTAQIEDKGVNGWQSSMEGGAATAAELSRPHITLADADGNLYIADKDANAVRKVDTDGVITTIAGPGEVSAPNGLWVVGHTIYILDLGNDRVAKLENDNLTTLFAIGGAGNGRGLWVSDDESVAYVSAGTVLKKWTPSAGVTTLATGFVSLGNLHVSPEGVLGVTDRSGHTVYAVDTDNGEKRVIAGNGTESGGGDRFKATDTGLHEVRGIWFEPSGGYLLCTHKGGDVWYVDVDGFIHLMIEGDDNDTHAGDGGRFDAPGDKISEPRAVTMSPDGEILITEHDGGYIRVVSAR